MKGLYRLLLWGLLPSVLCVTVFFMVLVVLTWENQSAVEELKVEFERQRDAWEAQAIRDYTVIFTSCAPNYTGSCCQDELLHISRGQLSQAPTCAPLGRYSYPSYFTVNTISQTYDWVERELLYGDDQWMDITYHPEYHYITQITFRPRKTAEEVTLGYYDLTPLR